MLDALRDMLAKLPETGAQGFEGLAAVACSQLSGTTFRLVKSGSQFGRDFEAVVQGAAILFEAKRYTSRLSYADLASKLVEALDRAGRPVEVWGVAATVPLDAAAAADLVKAGEQRGVSVLILDWTAPLPRLAVLLAAAFEAVVDWFGRHAADESATVTTCLEEIRRHALYGAGLASLQGELSQSGLGLAMARRRNAEWMERRFCDKHAAIIDFNQPLAPTDPRLRPPPIERRALETSVLAAVDRWTGLAQAVLLTGTTQGQAVADLQGDEGVGKSWAIARTWLTMMDDARGPRPLLLFMASHMWREGDEQRPIELLARLCMIQCGATTMTQADTERWIARLTRWLERPLTAGARPVAIVVLDGVNERSWRWATLITSLAGLARTWSLRLVVTSRRGAFDRDLAPQLRAIDVERVIVEAFSDRDLDDALVREGRDPASVREPLRTFLRNPRILSVGIPLLDRLDPDEVGVERLLFEYLVRRQEDRSGRSSLTAVQLAQTLVGHAREIRERLLSEPSGVGAGVFDHAGARGRLGTPWQELVDDLGDIVDSQFLRTVDARRNRYAFTTQALPLGMALLVVDELDKAVTDGYSADLPALLDAIVDPIAAIDTTSNLVLAALEVALADREIADAVAIELLIAVLVLQNLQPGLKSRIFAGLRERPAVYVAATDLLFGRRRGAGRREWMTDALASKRCDERVQSTLDAAIRRWLRSWQPAAIAPDLTGYPAEQATNIERDHDRRVLEHERTLASMTGAERAFVERELVILPAGRESGVDGVAVTLLSGRRLMPFASDLFAWCVAYALGWGSGAYEEMRWLRRLAPLDWEEVTQTIVRMCEDPVGEERSVPFGWVQYYALSFSGDPAQAERADALWSLIHDGPRRLRATDGLCEVDPLDFDAPAPEGDLSEVRQRYAEWCSQGERPPLLMRQADTVISSTRRVLCRFAPKWAADCHRAFARRASGIKEAAPAVIASFVSQDTAILEEAESTTLMSWLRRLLAEGQLAEINKTAPAHLLAAILPRLNPMQQFDVMTSMIVNEPHPFWLENFVDALPEGLLAARLEQAAQRGQACLRNALIFAGAHPVSARDVRPALAQALSSAEAASRGIALRTMIRLGAHDDIEDFASGGWQWSGTTAPDRGVEDFCGSLCLAKALASRDDPALLTRLHPALWSRAVLESGPAIASAVGDRLIEALAGVDASMRPPEGIAVACTRDDEGPGTVSELAGIEITISYPAGRLIEDPDGMRRRPLGMADYVAFEQRVLGTGRGPLLYPLTSAAVDRIAEQAPATFMRAVSLVESLKSGDPSAAATVIAHDFARSLSRSDAARAARLFSRFEAETPIIAEAMPHCGIARQLLLLWLAEDAPVIEDVRRRALDRAASDEVLATHAVAAAMAGKQSRMEAFILDRAESRHPAVMARALTLAGFSMPNVAFDDLLSQTRFAHGFLGEVRNYAQEAHRKAIWAERWFRSALTATSALDVWRFGELASASADARCVLWMEEGVGSPWFERTRPIFRNALFHSAASLARNRRGTLFGERAPSEDFKAFYS